MMAAGEDSWLDKATWRGSSNLSLTWDELLEGLGCVLSNRYRLGIIRLIGLSGPKSLSLIVKGLNLAKSKRPLIHYHLKVLEGLGLIEAVKTVRYGLRVATKYYDLTRKGRAVLSSLPTPY